MRLYLIPVMGMCFCVDGLLLAGAAKLTGRRPELLQVAVAAGIGAVMGGAGLLPGMQVLATPAARLVGLAGMAIPVFGLSGNGLRSGLMFALLNMAVGGLALMLGDRGPARYLIAALVVCLMCILALQNGPNGGSCVPVELEYGGAKTSIMALCDTGNQLRDPVTGESVLIVGAEVAGSLLGLSGKQLANPTETVMAGKIRGLRLIPYTTVGRARGMLLAVRMNDVRIGGRRVSTLVAFAPEGLGKNGRYQALTGGVA